MDGAVQRPDPVTTNAYGESWFAVDGTTVRFRIDLEDIEDVTLAAIRVGGSDVAGPILVELFNAAGNTASLTIRGTLIEGRFTEADLQSAGGIATLDAWLAAIPAGGTYVNVHTLEHPAGEIRGQIVPRATAQPAGIQLAFRLPSGHMMGSRSARQ